MNNIQKIIIFIVVLVIITLNINSFQLELSAFSKESKPIGTIELVNSTSTSITVKYKATSPSIIMDGSTITLYSKSDGSNSYDTIEQELLIDDISNEFHQKTFSYLDAYTTYKIGLNIPYDLDGNGIADNSDNLELSSLICSTSIVMPTAEINMETSYGSPSKISVDFTIIDPGPYSRNIHVTLSASQGNVVDDRIPTIIDSSMEDGIKTTSYNVTFPLDSSLGSRVYNVSILTDIASDTYYVDQYDVLLDSELFDSSGNKLI